MSPEERIYNLETQVKKQSKTLDFLLHHFKLVPDEEDFRIAVAAFTAGDPSLLENYVNRGGKISTEQKI